MDTGIDKAGKIIGRLLRQADQSLFFRYIHECTDKVVGEANPQHQALAIKKWQPSQYSCSEKPPSQSYTGASKHISTSQRRRLSTKPRRPLSKKFLNMFEKLVGTLASLQKTLKLKRASTSASPPR